MSDPSTLNVISALAAEPVSAPVIYSFVLTLLMAVAAGLVGSFALMKRMSLAGDVVSHIALPGLGVAYLLHYDPLVGAAVSLLLGSLLIWYLENRSTLNTEVAIGVIFTGALALGTLLTPSEDLVEALFGGFHILTLGWFLLGVLSVALIVVFIYHFRHALIISLFSPDLAATSGINLSRLNLYYILIFGLTVLLGLRFLGALLAGALIILPAAIGRQIASTLTGFLVASSVASVGSVLVGTMFAYAIPTVRLGAVQIEVQPGPAVITVAAILFLTTLLKRPR